MKVIMGVEFATQSREMVKLVSSMKFPNLELDLAHVTEVWASSNDSDPAADAQNRQLKSYVGQLEIEGRQTLSVTESFAKDQGIAQCFSQLLFGHISNELLNHADRLQADLLVLGSNGKAADPLQMGSVGRKVVANSRRSVMVIKDFSHFHQDGLTAVVATDHSPYASQCLEQFTKWAPAGIKRIVVVSVFSEHVIKGMTTLLDYPHPTAKAWVRSELARDNEQQIRRMKGLASTFESRVEEGIVGDVLARLMQEYQAAFLVLGSQGHGFLERLMIGSVSLEQAFKRPYSVLLMRPNP